MKTFSDSMGNQYSISLTVKKLRELPSVLGCELKDLLQDETKNAEFFTDPVRLVRVAAFLVFRVDRPQTYSGGYTAGLDVPGFEELIAQIELYADGETVDAIREALSQEISDFFLPVSRKNRLAEKGTAAVSTNQSTDSPGSSVSSPTT